LPARRWRENRRALLESCYPEFARLTGAKPLEALIEGATLGHAWQADHILPVYLGGGQCDVDNLRTLCTPCHAAVTAAQSRARREERAALKAAAAAAPARRRPAKRPKAYLEDSDEEEDGGGGGGGRGPAPAARGAGAGRGHGRGRARGGGPAAESAESLREQLRRSLS
jgi:hypothetical protein